MIKCSICGADILYYNERTNKIEITKENGEKQLINVCNRHVKILPTNKDYGESETD